MKPDGYDWIKYSSLGIEMAVIVGAAVGGGIAIDRKRNATFPLFTLLLFVLGMVIAVIRLLRAVDKD
ncbi:MAG: AtpZ/AtpI family protein [Bacteroidales bacterium]|nr:AtpZ/AtpI family protein [Bacteroidales bacterium]